MLSESKIHYGFVIVFCCFLIMAIDVGLVMSCAGIFYKPVSEDLGVSVGRFGLYMSLNFLFASLTLSVAGKLLEKYSARWILAGSSSALGITVASMSLFNAIWQFYLAGAVAGVCMSFLMYLSFPTMINRWFRSRVGLMMGLCSAASGMGGVLFNPVGASIISVHGWRAGYLVFGLLILLLVSPLLAILLRDRPSDKGLEPFTRDDAGQPSRARKDVPGTGYQEALRMPVFYLMGVFAFLIMSVSTLNLFIPSYVSEIGYSLKTASVAASAVMFGVTVGKIALGWINDRKTLWGLLATTCLGITGIALLMCGKIGTAAILAGGFFFGWEYAGVTVQTPLLVRAIFGGGDFPKIYSNISIALAAGGAIMSGTWGLLADRTSYSFILFLGICFLVVCCWIGVHALKGRR